MTNFTRKTELAKQAERDLKDATGCQDPDMAQAYALQSIAASLIEIRECLEQLAHPAREGLRAVA